MRIDLHTHIFTSQHARLCQKIWLRRFCSSRSRSIDLYGLHDERQRTLSSNRSNCWDIEKRLEECDRDNVTAQVLSTIPVLFAYWAKPEHTMEVSKFINDHLASVVAAHPTRFIGLGTVPMQETTLACFELERVVKQLKMPGIGKLGHTSMEKISTTQVSTNFGLPQNR